MSAVIAYRALRSATCPRSIPHYHCIASLPGANPDTMAPPSHPLERQFHSIAGLDPWFPSSQPGVQQKHHPPIRTEPRYRRATVDVETRHCRSHAPAAAGMPTPALVPQSEPGGLAHHHALPASNALSDSDEYAGRPWWAQRISMVDGVAQVQVFGPPRTRYGAGRPQQLATRQIGLNENRRRAAKLECQFPTGPLPPAHCLQRPGSTASS